MLINMKRQVWNAMCDGYPAQLNMGYTAVYRVLDEPEVRRVQRGLDVWSLPGSAIMRAELSPE